MANLHDLPSIKRVLKLLDGGHLDERRSAAIVLHTLLVDLGFRPEPPPPPAAAAAAAEEEEAGGGGGGGREEEIWRKCRVKTTKQEGESVEDEWELVEEEKKEDTTTTTTSGGCWLLMVPDLLFKSLLPTTTSSSSSDDTDDHHLVLPQDSIVSNTTTTTTTSEGGGGVYFVYRHPIWSMLFLPNSNKKYYLCMKLIETHLDINVSFYYVQMVSNDISSSNTTTTTTPSFTCTETNYTHLFPTQVSSCSMSILKSLLTISSTTTPPPNSNKKNSTLLENLPALYSVLSPTVLPYLLSLIYIHPYSLPQITNYKSVHHHPTLNVIDHHVLLPSPPLAHPTTTLIDDVRPLPPLPLHDPYAFDHHRRPPLRGETHHPPQHLLFKPDGNLIGPHHPAFGNLYPTLGGPLSRIQPPPSPRNGNSSSRFDPIGPLGGGTTSGEPDPDAMPTFGRFTDHMFL